MTDLTAYVAAAVFLVFGAHRLAVTRTAGADPAQRYVSAFALCMTPGMLLNAPSTEALVGRPAPQLVESGLLAHALKTGGLSFLVLVALALRVPAVPRAPLRRQIALAVAVQVGSVALFLAAGVGVRDGSVVTADGHGWQLAGYNTLFAVYGAWCLLVLGRELARHATRTDPGLLRTGLRLMMLATVVGVLWTLWTFDDVADNLAHGRQAMEEDLTANSLGAVTAAFATGGATVTLWGGPLSARLRWLRARRRWLALDPLWSALHSELPEIALTAGAPPRQRPALRHAEFALYRRIIEIRDGHLALRAYFHPAVPAWVAEAADPDPHDAVVEAAAIAAALANRRCGRCHDAGAEPAPPPHVVSGTVDAEAAWLLQVTDAFTRSPVVAHVRARVAADTAGSGPAGSTGVPGATGAT
ncbi:hypothetical protein SAMN05216223_106120 [Actinacidiphila yanglinensis]|uniref:DUF6545 domain-containing protein n=1 Tax=Actinacidiphila yanglinensis TaxID=310779 RepID=A0A1H6B0Q8_9ACTN|nr:MAB_1171c family putative transporter [Actinacidiphila yanglinensis]SEG54398.1 hypothetical protein SAMN05216223_106120 [Actinacidiphila yanglinensis]